MQEDQSQNNILLEHNIVRELNKLLCIFELIQSHPKNDGEMNPFCNDGLSATNMILNLFEQYRSNEDTIEFKNRLKIDDLKNPFYVIVDDDVQICDQWGMNADKHNIKFMAFHSFKDFLSNIEQIPKGALLFLDSQIDGESLKGEDVGRFLYQGNKFDNIILQTGLSKSLFNNYSSYFLDIREKKTFLNISELTEKYCSKGEK